MAETLGDAEGILVIDETGFLKKGTHSVGVQRQYSGTAGRVENCQIAVLLGYATPAGRALLDRALYLPKSWTDDIPIGLGVRPLRDVIADLPADAWQRLRAGEGSQGPRFYDWQMVPLSVVPRRCWRRGLLIQRSVSDPSDVKAHRCFYPDDTAVATLVQVAGSRWTIETDIEEAKGEVGLDHYEVRSWDGWYRHIGLALLAHAFLAGVKAKHSAVDVAALKGGAHAQPTEIDDGLQDQHGALVPLSVPEFRRLLRRLLLTVIRPAEWVLAWSRWRRRHQAIAQACHRRRRQRLLMALPLEH